MLVPIKYSFLFIFSFLIISILRATDGPALVIKCHTDTACYMTFDKRIWRTCWCCAYALVLIWTSLLQCIWCWDCVVPLPGLIIPFLYPGPFLDYHVWLTQSAATRMRGVLPSLDSPAVRGYIIAEPCWACRTALCACH